MQLGSQRCTIGLVTNSWDLQTRTRVCTARVVHHGQAAHDHANTAIAVSVPHRRSQQALATGSILAGGRQRWRLRPSSSLPSQSAAPTDAAGDTEATEAAMRSAKERLAGGAAAPDLPRAMQAEADDLKAKFARIQAEVASYRTLSAETIKLEEEVARLRKENEELGSRVEAAAAAADAAGPLQQQMQELAMQLANSQAQLERLGEAAEAAEADKAEALKALQEERAAKGQLLGALTGAATRLADLVFPPGSLPPGITITTRLDGRMQAGDGAAAAAAAAGAPAEGKLEQEVAMPAEAEAEGEVEASFMAVMEEEAEQEAPASPAEPVLAAQASESAPAAEAAAPSALSVEAESPAPAAPTTVAPEPQPHQRRSRGFFGWLLGCVAFWLYQALGALTLYYAASILTGRPPVLTLEFGLGCLLVCTALPWLNGLLVPRAA